MTARIRALTVWQPWCSLLAVGWKPLENRGWSPSPAQLAPGDYVALHAGAKRDRESWVCAREILNELRDEGQRLDHPAKWTQPLTFAGGPYGAIVGVAVLDEIRTTPREIGCPWWNHSPGNVGWYMRDPVLFAEPVTAPDGGAIKGAQGLWTLPADVLVTVRERYRAATLGRVGQ
jgi:hypothetical protein